MGKQIKLTAKDGVTIGAYEAAPKGIARGGLVVLQEIFGVNQPYPQRRRRFRRAGLSCHRAGALRSRRAGRRTWL